MTCECTPWYYCTAMHHNAGNTEPAAEYVPAAGHAARPDDMPEPGDRCKDCGADIVWRGAGEHAWVHADDAETFDNSGYE